MNTAIRFAAIAVAIFVLLELTARVYLYGMAGLVPARMNSVHGLNQTGFTRRSDEPRIGFELAPNLDGYFKLVPFRTNSRGLRDREYALEKPADTFRVAVVGSSFTLPAGVEIERAYHSLLEEQLSAEFAPHRFEFINFAVGTHGGEQILAMLELRAMQYEPDLILLAMTRLSMPLVFRNPNPPGQEGKALLQLSRNRKTLARKNNRLVFQKSYPIFQSFLARLIERRIGKTLKPGRQVGIVERLVMETIDAGSDPVIYSRLPAPPQTLLERLGEIGSATGIPIVLISLEFESTRPAPKFSADARARRHGLHFFSTQDAFQGTRPSDYWINALDPHPNDRAHAIYARVIGEFLRTQELIPR